MIATTKKNKQIKIKITKTHTHTLKQKIKIKKEIMKSKLKTHNFAESPICGRYKFNGNPQSSKDVLEFIEKQINDIFHAKLIFFSNVIGQFYFVLFYFFFIFLSILRGGTPTSGN